jgi:uracil-DNA glycosylase
MFIGEGPGVHEEEEGRPFVGKSGSLLREVLQKLKFEKCYITNIVACRACSVAIDPTTNLPRMRRGRGGAPDTIMYTDQVPTPPQIQACLPRLYEEIYIVDPILIVALGNTAAETLLQRPVAITKERGRTEHCVIPGITSKPVLTEKKQVWGRMVHGVYQMPIEQNEVRYLVMPALHPAFVLRRLVDRGPNSPSSQFIIDIKTAVRIYEKYLIEALRFEPVVRDDIDFSNVGMEEDPDE